MNAEGLSLWLSAKEGLLDETITLSRYTSSGIRGDFKKVAINMARYKFIAKLLQNKKTLLEIGCNDGFFTQSFAEAKSRVVGIDFDAEAVDAARKSFSSEKMTFINNDFFDEALSEKFDSVVAMDVIEHIAQAREKEFMDKVFRALDKNGIAVIGTPNIEAAKHQSELSAKAHINMFSHDRLLRLMSGYFANVFLFSANDEIVHTGFYPMAHYFIAVGVGLLPPTKS